MEKQEIQDIAIAEIIYPTFALTKQFLAVNKIAFKENMPFIEDIILKEEEKVAEVYFPIEGERYYFVVYIDLKPQIAVRWMGMSPGIGGERFSAQRVQRAGSIAWQSAVCKAFHKNSPARLCISARNC